MIRNTLRLFALCLIFVFGSLACVGTPPHASGCTNNDACGAGEVCLSGGCARLCNLQRDCSSDMVCFDGRCRERVAGDPPTISDVAGNNPLAVGVISDGLIIAGTGLAFAVFELRGATDAVELPARSRAEKSAEVTLPVDILSGDYTLVASNQSGSSPQALTLTLPELWGDEIVSRINAVDTTSTIAVARLAGVQERVTGTCAVGSSIREINSDGTVACDAPTAATVSGLLGGSLASGVIPRSDGSDLTTSALHQGADGMIGINTTTPGARLDIAGGSVEDDRRWVREYQVSDVDSQPFLDRGGNPAGANFTAIVFCADEFTNRSGVSAWLIKRKGSSSSPPVWGLTRFATNGPVNSPELYDDAGSLRIRMEDQSLDGTQIHSVACMVWQLQ